MSSSNLVEVTLIEESSYGVTPSVGNFNKARFISESLSGTPETTESAQIRTDRMSSGQVVTGLTVGGGVDFELAKEATLELLMSSAMMSNWILPVAVVTPMAIDTVAKTITRETGTFVGAVNVGDMLTLSGFLNVANNTQVMITDVDALVLGFTSSSTVTSEPLQSNWVTATLYTVGTIIKYTDGKIYECVTEHTSNVFATDSANWDILSTGNSFKVCDHLVIGATKKSFSVQKKFIDLANKGIVYRGMLASEMNLSINYGEIVNGSFTFSGNDYETVGAEADFITYTRTVNAAATTNSFNGSVDMPFIASDAAGVLDKVNFCIQNVELGLNNNLTPQTCIGSIAPKDYSAGTANISVSLSTYLSDENWALLAKKLNQIPFGLGFAVKNAEGFYGFYLPAVQVSFEDPASGGANQDVMLEMEGVAKVGTNGVSALKIFRA
jgi:hypothetical protein